MYCDRCDRPVPAVKNTHRLRNSLGVLALPATGGLSAAGMKGERYVCPTCGGHVRAASGSWRARGGSGAGRVAPPTYTDRRRIAAHQRALRLERAAAGESLSPAQLARDQAAARREARVDARRERAAVREAKRQARLEARAAARSAASTAPQPRPEATRSSADSQQRAPFPPPPGYPPG